MTNMNASGPLKLITCILYRKAGIAVLQALHERGINSAFMNHARGSAIGDHEDEKGQVQEFEKEIVTVVVNESQAEDTFQFIFETANIDRAHGGLMYMETLHSGIQMSMPSTN